MNPAGAKVAEPYEDRFAEEVRRELGRVLQSTVFRGSHRCKSFLEFVVTKALHGDSEALKERTLAVELFGRDAAADLAEDSIVRVGAREVRKRLAQHYLGEGAGDPVRIELPSGSYVPVFHHASPRHQVTGETAVETALVHAETEPAVRPRRLRLRLGVVGLVLAAGVAVLVWRWMGRAPSDFEVFWQPILSQRSAVIVALGHPLVYHPSTRAHELTDAKDGPPSLPFLRPVDLALLKGTDFVPVFDQYTGFGDTVAAVRVVSFLTERSRSARVRLASKLDFNDLRDSVTILIGAFTNRWTTELTHGFRYQFGVNESRQPCIIDTTTGKSRWVTAKGDNGSSTEDYILICRLPHSQTGRFTLVAAGLTQYGTQEAGRILGEPEALMSLLKQLPPNWSQKNVELVLHSQVVGDAPTPPELAGWYVW